ncbi:MAG: SusD/RagB family nutrient-binding outer membrane lipoprotein [Lewinellaceae bacterium]|nr:SusD/RagB family nutrient-binding outer membrane lipoprotein [Phaeodactylibacter sp.]MCB9041806.1 SusD/RagB family nutrient-binding outer membrane lipoprotein [Lewinellaceae bacterium]
MKRLICLFFLASLAFSCGNLVDGINQDPNNPTSASYQYILTGAEVGNIIVQSGETARRAGIFCGYYTGIDRQHEGFSQYSLTTSDFNSLWYDVYVDAYRNALETQKAAEEEGVGGVTQGITQVLQAQILGTAASLYGDIPFDDAGKIEVENPRYEDQLVVYGKVQSLLDEAIQNLQAGTGRPASGSDIYFDGAPTPWIEVAYTLKARFYMHTREYANAYTAAGNGISARSNAMYAPHGTGNEESNLSYLFFAVEVRGADLVTSDFMASLIHPDPAASPDFSNYRGNAKTDETGRFNFYFLTNSVGIQPNTTDGFAAQTAPAPLVTFEENLLILAEAGFRTQGFNTGLGHLNEFRAFMAGGGYLSNAVPAQLLYDPYGPEDFAAGGMENPDGLSADDALLREILEERYVTFFGQTEGFNDTRRTQKDTGVRVRVQPNTGSELPQRFLYPQTEIDRNANVPSPIPGLFQPTDVNN